MEVTKPYKFMGFGAMDVTKPYKFIGFGAMEVTKPYKFIRFGAAQALAFISVLAGSTLQSLGPSTLSLITPNR